MPFAAGSILTGVNRTFSTNFLLTENPISQNNMWIQGFTDGLDWGDVQTNGSIAYGTTDDISPPPYTDSIAVIRGLWNRNQMAQAVVHTVNQQSGGIYEEVELRLLNTISQHSITGYEINFSCRHDGTQYTQIGRYQGANGNTSWAGIGPSPPSTSVTGPGLFDGDIVKATIINGLITVYINNVQVNQVTDITYTSGSPGIGFFMQDGPIGLLSDFGFTQFTASNV